MLAVPQGFRFAGVHCGLKQMPGKLDLCLVVSQHPCSAAGVYTRNLVFAAPVAFDRARTPGNAVQAVVINSGNANACTGEQGEMDASAMARLACEAAGLPPERALVMSTGVIGHYLPMDRVELGIQAAARELEQGVSAVERAAAAIMTTDTRPKLASRILSTGAVVLGMAKGAAMIAPNLATMLALIVTDAQVSSSDGDQILKDAVKDSFNCISVDGHTSTNDTVLFLANGAAAQPSVALLELNLAVREVCEELARAIIDDGEGTTHSLEIRVRGCRSVEDAQKIARSVGASPLVKAAMAGADPNWGRIVSAAGYAGATFDPSRVSLWLNNCRVYESGQPTQFDERQLSQSIASQRLVTIELQFSEGDAAVRYWTTDLTPEYVKLNADYRT